MLVRDSDYQTLVAGFADNNVIREAPEKEPLCSLCAGRSRHRNKWRQVVFEKVQRRVESLLKLNPEAWPFLVIPSRCGCCLV